MNDNVSCVLFTVNEQRYGMPSACVERIVQLPALTKLPETPAYMAGIFDLGGVMIPMLDLTSVLKLPATRHLLTDTVMVLRGAGHPFGVIANQVMDVCTILQPAAERILSGFSTTSGTLIAGAARVDNEVVLVLDTEKLEDLLSWRACDHSDVGARACNPDFTPSERDIFRQRARGLMSRTGESADQ